MTNTISVDVDGLQRLRALARSAEGEQPITIQAPVVPRIYRRHAIRTWTDEQWDRIPVSAVRIDRVIPTQDAVTIAAIHRWLTNPDDLPARVVYDLERYWLHDGHHRWLIKALAGHRYLDAHIVDHNGNPIEVQP